MTDRDQEKRDAMRRLVPEIRRSCLATLAAAQDAPDDLAAVGHPYRQRAGGVASESQPVRSPDRTDRRSQASAATTPMA
jgi:hypothetical protein